MGGKRNKKNKAEKKEEMKEEVKAEEPKHEMELAAKIERNIVSSPRGLADPGTPFPQL